MTFITNLHWRYAAKKFSGEKVGDLELQKIKEAIRLAPSSFGVQPFHVLIIENNKQNRNVVDDLIKNANRNEKIIATCSRLIVFCNRLDISSRFNKLLEMQKRQDKIMHKIGILLTHFAGIFNFILFKRWTTKNAWSKMQTYIALGFALAACAELGVDSCPMEGFNSKKFQKLLNLPRHIKPVVLLAVGSRDENDASLKFTKTRFSEEDLFTMI